jgi:putative chitinase
MILTKEQLEQILSNNKFVNDWYVAISISLPKYNIDTPERIAGFLSQCSHESAGFTALVENLNYRSESLRRVFPKYFPTEQIALKYAHQPIKIASRVYANRMGNGNEESGDGWLFKGRGVIQITGRNNYTAFGNYIGMEIGSLIHYMETFSGAIESACWYWSTRNLNSYCDNEDLVGLSKAINGGTNGLEDRIEKYNKYFEILNG